jgi:hypothetical protein
VFRVRGPQYLSDRAKIAAGSAAYHLTAVDLVATPTAVPHLAQFLPSVRWAMWHDAASDAVIEDVTGACGGTIAGRFGWVHGVC